MTKTLLAALALTFLSGCITSRIAYNAALGPEDGYSVRMGRVIYVQYDNSFPAFDTKTLDADAKTFVVFRDGHRDVYAKDKNSVWFFGNRFEGPDPTTFEILEEPFYARDKDHVYYRDKIIEGASPSSFYLRVIPPAKEGQEKDVVGVDGDRIFLGSGWAKGLDPLSYAWTGEVGFIRDKNDIYFGVGRPLNVCDQESWHVEKRHLSRDKQCAYILDKKLTQIDFETFEFLYSEDGRFFGDIGYHKDRSRVWMHAYDLDKTEVVLTEIEGADAQSFVHERNDTFHMYARDKLGCFKNSQRIDCSNSPQSERGAAKLTGE